MILLRFDIRGVAQLVAYLVWDQRVVSSSLATPTKENQGVKHCLAPFLFYLFAHNLHTGLFYTILFINMVTKVIYHLNSKPRRAIQDLPLAAWWMYYPMETFSRKLWNYYCSQISCLRDVVYSEG